MKKLLFILPLFILTWCSLSINKTTNNSSIDNVNNIQVTTMNENTIQTGISNEVENELKILYGQVTFSHIYTLWSYIIADANDWSNSILVVAWKISNKRLKFYDWNSGEISCKITDLFWFPKQLLEIYNSDTPCYEEWAEYTIPKETMEYIKK